MLTKQKQFIEYVQKIDEYLKKLKIDVEHTDLEERIQTQELIIPVIGGFSAGKSSAINQFLGENILSVGVTPETALATELRDSQENYFEAIANDSGGENIRYTISQMQDIQHNSYRFQYLKLFLNNEKIQQIKPLVLVDMPGFNAPIDHHNQAILSYLSKGVYFIILMSCEDGTVHRSLAREIDNIVKIGKGFVFCLSKSNLKSQSDVELIRTETQSYLKDHFGYQDEVLLLDKNSSDVLMDILKKIDPNTLIERIYLPILKFQNKQIISNINFQISSLKMDVNEALTAIETLSEEIQKLSDGKEERISEIDREFSSQNLEGILKIVVAELTQQKNYLIDLLMKNKDVFTQEVNSIVSSVLITEIPQRFSSAIETMLEDIKNNLGGIGEYQMDVDWIDTFAHKITSLGPKGKIVFPRIGVLGAFLNPIIGVVVAFLPEIIGYFKQNLVKQQAENYFSNDFLPLVKIKLRPILKQEFSRYIRESIEKISQELEEEIRQKQEIIKQKQEEKQKHQGELEAQIAQLNQAKSEIQALAEQFLCRSVDDGKNY